MGRRRRRTNPVAPPAEIFILDVGPLQYGDAILCRFGETTVLIDGGHPGDEGERDEETGEAEFVPLQKQLEQIFGHPPPFPISLLIVTHAHLDHVGCLPALIANGWLTCEWALLADPVLGWGPPDVEPPTDGLDRDTLRLLAALREEPPPPSATTDELRAFLNDAVDVEGPYYAMIEALRAAGSDVVLYGKDDHRPLEDHFASLIGFDILGPSGDHLNICARRILAATNDAIDAIRRTRSRDATLGAVDLYRRLMGFRRDADSDAALADGESRPGAAVNNQSLVVRFAWDGRKFLFTGDMQLARPEVPNLEPEMVKLRQAIVDDGPYAFAKLPHHGSLNACDETVLTDVLRTPPRLAISTGYRSKKHPDPELLAILAARQAELTWYRTDRNGAIALTYAGDEPDVSFARNAKNDTTEPGGQDRPVPATIITPRQSLAPAVTRQANPSVTPPEPVGPARDTVEVVTRIPHVATRVTVTVDVAPGPASGPPPPGPVDNRPQLTSRLGGGRSLPPLFFITSREALIEHIGQNEADSALRMIADAGMPLFADLPANLTSALDAVPWTRPELARHPEAAGVVILGNHDVVPSLPLDVLGPTLRGQLEADVPADERDDDDDWTVWNDDQYGCHNGDGYAELPVSRIPDGWSSRLVIAALTASPATQSPTRAGVRNHRRPFADQIFATIPGVPGAPGASMLQSKPGSAARDPRPDLAADRVYLMLHGGEEDGSRFWGELGLLEYVEAVNVGNVAARPGTIVFAGCCWGALTVEQPAYRAPVDRPPAGRGPRSSVALAFLEAGATAFVGCTGVHYSPRPEPGAFGASAPLHAGFWQRVGANLSPARALFETKAEYLRLIPTDPDRLVDQAVGLKTYHQFTCLGLGW